MKRAIRINCHTKGPLHDGVNGDPNSYRDHLTQKIYIEPAKLNNI